ncbi:MAG: hypothetical protein WBL72_09025 [Thermoguttaceae bacterium]
MKLPFAQTFWVGVALLPIVPGYVALDALHYRRPLWFFRWRIPLPPLLNRRVNAGLERMVAQ